MLFEILLAIICFVLAILLMFFIPFLFGAPYEPSRKKAIEKMIKFSEVKKGEKSVDLGSGDGRLVRAFAKAGAEAHGYEINPFLVFYSKYKTKKLGIKNAYFHWGNFWKVSLSKFDIVTSFQIGYIMPKLEKKLLRELPTGARVVSNTWKFKNWKVKKIEGRIRLYVRE
jgi:SAM-dependent methyltransferase